MGLQLQIIIKIIVFVDKFAAPKISLTCLTVVLEI